MATIRRHSEPTTRRNRNKEISPKLQRGFVDALGVVGRSRRAPSSRVSRGWLVAAREVLRRCPEAPAHHLSSSGVGAWRLRRGCFGVRFTTSQGSASMPQGFGSPPLEVRLTTPEAPDTHPWGYPSPPHEHPLLGRTGAKSIIFEKIDPGWMSSALSAPGVPANDAATARGCVRRSRGLRGCLARWARQF